jgi:hypothetical protein
VAECLISKRMIWKRGGYEVIGIILLQASYLYTSSLLRGVTFKVLPLSSYVLSPTTLPLQETFLGLASRAEDTFFYVLNILKFSSL